MTDLRAGRTVLVTAHGNSLRALAAHLDHLSQEILGLNIPTGMPLVYRLDMDSPPRSAGVLDPDVATAEAALVAGQGR